MRLGQLARKLAIPPSEISDFLTSQGMPSLEGNNARLSTEQLAAALQRFAPALSEDLLKSDLTDEATEEPVAVQAPVVEAFSSPIVENIASQTSSTNTESQSEPSDETGSEKPEVIKAQKVALSGLKVLGKIELPQPKKKITELPSETPEESKQVSSPENNNRPAFEKRKEHQKRERREQRPAKNPIVLAREREAKAAEEKRREDEKRRKEQRTLNYQKRVKAPAPTKAARLVNEEVERMSEVDLKPAPKTWFGKFWRWFTS